MTDTSAASRFEDDVKRLETIVRDLEGGELALEDAFERFEEGMRLAAACRKRIDAIEGRVAELLASGDTEDVPPAEGT